MARAGLDMELIMQAAAELADRNGLEEVTLASLAKKLNIRSPSLYNHVDGLPGLRRKLAVYGMRRLNEQLTHSAVGRSQDDAVRAMSLAYVQFAREHPGLYDATVRAPDWGDEETKHVAAETVELIVRVLQGYGLEGEEAVHTVRGLHSMLHGFSSLEQTDNFNLPIDRDYSLHLLIDYFIAGIRSRRDL